MNKNIIRIALAMGWRRVGRTAESALYYPPGCTSYGPFGSKEPPNPLTSHDDCRALIEWLNRRHVDVEVRHKDTHSEVVMRWFDDEGHRVFDFWDSRSKKDDSDYRIGVVELTLKILDEVDSAADPV